jgi:hypothetical protein
MSLDSMGETARGEGPFAFRLGQCRFCPGDRALADGGNMTFGTIQAEDGTYEMLVHQWWCPVLNPNPPLDI